MEIGHVRRERGKGDERKRTEVGEIKRVKILRHFMIHHALNLPHGTTQSTKYCITLPTLGFLRSTQADFEATERRLIAGEFSQGGGMLDLIGVQSIGSGGAAEAREEEEATRVVDESEPSAEVLLDG